VATGNRAVAAMPHSKVEMARPEKEMGNIAEGPTALPVTHRTRIRSNES
jgi:hypothetical protein